jgi:hypothetical protein
MENSKKEVTVSQPADILEKITILQDRYNVIEALEDYNKKLMDNCEISQSILKARLGTWYLRHQGYIHRVNKDKEEIEKYKEIEALIFFNNKTLTNQEVLMVIMWLNNICDHLRITLVDTKKHFDKTDIELDNMYNGLD